MSLCNGCDDVVVHEQRGVESSLGAHLEEGLRTEGRVSGDGNAELLGKSDHLGLGEVGVVFDLKNGGLDLGVAVEVNEERAGEVGDTNVLCVAKLDGFLKLGPGLRDWHVLKLHGALLDVVEKVGRVALGRVDVLLSNGEVNEPEIKVVKTPIVERLLGQLEDVLLGVESVPELGGDKELLAGDETVGDGLADTFAGFLLVTVVLGAVDEAVSGLDGVVDGLGACLLRDLPDAEADKRHLSAGAGEGD